ncbi:uncharacterized protein LOC118202490 isoform X2 [Stegodyphus dumicola]|uniref:uncharacterized protein LOC118202490 isoform X2 n=1 Tax=Stegodyphus dumicola TaxID=202533 RepID=UPI0015B25774|nr:uncharacterized protein LOC118202490 isoform X2 [Stegodyphus dumicola]
MANYQTAQQKITRIREEFKSQIVPLIRGILAEEPNDITSYCAQYFQRLLANRQKAVEGEPDCLQSSNLSSQTNYMESQATTLPHVQGSTSLPVLTETSEKLQLRETSSWSGSPNARPASGKRTVIFDPAEAAMPIGDQVNIAGKDEEYAEETGKLGDARPIEDKNKEEYSYNSSFESRVNEEFWTVQHTDLKECTECMPSAPPYESDDGEREIKGYFASVLSLGSMQQARGTCKYWSMQSKDKEPLHIKSESPELDNKVDDLIDSLYQCHIDEGEESELQSRKRISASSPSGFNSRVKYFISEIVDEERNEKDMNEVMNDNSGMHLKTSAEIKSIGKNFCSSFSELEKEFSITESNLDDEFSKPKEISDIQKSQEKRNETLESQIAFKKNGESCYESHNSPEEEKEKMVDQFNITSGRQGNALGGSYSIDSQKCLLSKTKEKCSLVSRQDEILSEVHDKHKQLIKKEEDAAVLVKENKKTGELVASDTNRLQKENNYDLNETLFYKTDKGLNMMNDTKNKHGVTNIGFRTDDEDDSIDESWKRKWYASHPRLDHHLSKMSQNLGPSLHPCKPQLPVPSSKRRRRNLPVIREKGDVDPQRQRLLRYGQRVQLPQFNRMLTQIQSTSPSRNRNDLPSPNRRCENILKEREDTSEKPANYNSSDKNEKQTHEKETDCAVSKFENIKFSEICDENELYLHTNELEDISESNDGKLSIPEGSIVNEKQLSRKIPEDHLQIKVSQNDKQIKTDFIPEGNEQPSVQENKVSYDTLKKINSHEKLSMSERREQNESFMQNMTPTSSSYVPLLQESYMTSASTPELLNCLQTAENIIDLCTFSNNEETRSKPESLNTDSNESLSDGHEFNLGVLAEGDRASSQDSEKQQTVSSSKTSPKSTDVEPGLKSACGDFASPQNNSVVANRQQIRNTLSSSNLDISINSSRRNLNAFQESIETTNNISTEHALENNEGTDFSYYTDSDSFEFDSSDLSEEEGNENTDAADPTAQENKQ